MQFCYDISILFVNIVGWLLDILYYTAYIVHEVSYLWYTVEYSSGLKRWFIETFTQKAGC